MRWDERHRRLRWVLPPDARFLDYAPLMDMTRPGPGLSGQRFVGMSALSWLRQLKNSGSPDLAAARNWYAARMALVREYCDKLPRTPDPYFGVELAVPQMVSLLASALRAMGLKRASVAQWRSTLIGLSARGIKEEEIRLSGVLDELALLGDVEVLTLEQVLALVDTAHLHPRLVSEATHGFFSRGGWKECCERISPPNLRGLGVRRRAQHRVAIRRALVRYRHRTFGWRLIREAWLPDLIGPERHLWYIHDERGRPLHGTRAAPYTSRAEAMAAAIDAMRKRYRAWYRAHPVQRWSSYVAGGAEQYSELLIQLDELPADYRSGHFRTRNILAHVRTSLRTGCEGERVCYLDEVQSDWHADLQVQARGDWPANKRPVADAPFGKEWPLLVLKLMLWRAQAIGAEALAWSTLEMQTRMWGQNRVPEVLYKRRLPEAARTLAKALKLEQREIRIPFHGADRYVDQSSRGWVVLSDKDGRPLCRPFDTREQAERFLDLTVRKTERTVPALMLAGLPRIKRIPLYGVGGLADWG